MKKKYLASIVLAGLLCGSAPAQTTSAPAPTPQTFLQTAEGYFTSFNTNLGTFSTNAPIEFWTGASYQSGLNVGAQVALEAHPFGKLPGLTLGSVTTMAGIGGTFASQEEDVGWSIVHYDVELGLGAGVNYNFQNGAIEPGVYAEVKKALTENTFAGVRLEEYFNAGSKREQPIVTLFAGFTF